MDCVSHKKSLVRNESSAWWCSCWFCLINQRMSTFSNRIHNCAWKIAYFSFFYRNKFPYKLGKNYKWLQCVYNGFPFCFSGITDLHVITPRNLDNNDNTWIIFFVHHCKFAHSQYDVFHICIYCLKIYARIFKNKSK